MSIQWPRELYKIVYDYLPFSDQLWIASGATKISGKDKRYHEIFVFFQSIVVSTRESIHTFLAELEIHNANYINGIIEAYAKEKKADLSVFESAYYHLEVSPPPFAEKWPDSYPTNYYPRYERIIQYYRENASTINMAFKTSNIRSIGYGYLRSSKDKEKRSIIAETGRILSSAGLTLTQLFYSRAAKDGWLDIMPFEEKSSCTIM